MQSAHRLQRPSLLHRRLFSTALLALLLSPLRLLERTRLPWPHPSSPPTSLATASEWQGQADIVYNPVQDEYLITWQDRRSANWDIYAQRVSGSGTPIGGNIGVCLVSDDQLAPAVAYNSVDNDYVIVWQQRKPGAMAVQGQRLSATGALLGARFAVGGSSTRAWEPTSPTTRLATSISSPFSLSTPLASMACRPTTAARSVRPDGRAALRRRSDAADGSTPANTCWKPARGRQSVYDAPGPGRASRACHRPRARRGEEQVTGSLTISPPLISPGS